MNILVYSTAFYPGIGGIENQTLLLTKEFIKSGHNVKVITLQKQTAPLKDVQVYYRPGILTSIKLFRWCSTYYMPNISLKGVWLLALNPKKTWIISHNDFSSCNRKGLLPGLKNFANKFATKNIAVSKSIGRFLNPSTEVVYNCYDDSLFKLYPDEKRTIDFVFLGRLVTQKGCDLLIRACSELRQPFTLTIIGIGPEEQRLKDLANKLGLNKKVFFIGALTGENLVRQLNKCKVMVVPSLLGEGFGMVVLEGLACGCKIIAADAAGLAEAVNVHGLKFPMGDQKALTKLLEDALENDQLAQPDEHKLRSYLKSRSRSSVSESYLKFFN